MDLVLVGDDGSDDAAVAVGWASRFAIERGAEVASVHVPASGEHVARNAVNSEPSFATAIQRSRSWKQRVTWTRSVIVLGRRGRGGFPGVPMGGIASHVAAMSALPVVVVPVVDLFAPEALLQRVVVGIDGLPESLDAAVWAARELRQRALHRSSCARARPGVLLLG